MYALTVNVGIDEPREDRQVPKIYYFTIKRRQIAANGEWRDIEYESGVSGYGNGLILEYIQGVWVKQLPSQDNRGRGRFNSSLF